MANWIGGFGSPKPTDAEIAEGKPKREAFRKEVQIIQTELNESKDAFSKLKLNDTQIQNVVKKSETWIQANVEVTPRDVDKEKTIFKEGIEREVTALRLSLPADVAMLSDEDRKTVAAQIKYPALKNYVEEAIQQYNSVKESQERERIQKEMNRTAGDDVSDIGGMIGKILGPIFFLIIALRLGSYAANASLHLPTPYRVLNFIYTALFSPILLFYYLFFILRNYFFPETYAPLRIEAMLPFYIIKKEENENKNNLVESLFGYTPSNEILSEIARKQEDLEKRRQEALTT
jgi:hypothetical protein